MDIARGINDEQSALWNGPAGQAWVEAQAVLDRTLQPFEDLLVEPLGARSGERELDIGCGTGSTTLAAARRLGTAGCCVGIDLSEPMIAAARARGDREGSPARFILADAQTHPFEATGFDRLISRFGVMFFDDPVRAFANLRRAAGPNAALQFVAWRSPAENPFMTTAERAAAPLLPTLPARQPDAPGQFAFADPQRIGRILHESGWVGADIRPLDVACTLPESALVGYFSRLGPLGLVLREADDGARARIIETVRTAFDPYVEGTNVRFTAACWMIEARAPSA
ncbi:MAG: class I SAM-dependent methyltransferase [Alphaproteobacteria bacterium]